MDNHEFELLYQQYVTRVFRFLLKLSCDYYIAEELTQEVFLRAFINIYQFRGDSSLFVWLCQIGKNLYYNLLRVSKKTSFLDEMKLIKSDFDLEEKIIIAEEVNRITEILFQLSEPYQSVFFFHIYLELNYNEIGIHYKKTATWARVTYFRAKNMIQEKIKEGTPNEM